MKKLLAATSILICSGFSQAKLQSQIICASGAHFHDINKKAEYFAQENPNAEIIFSHLVYTSHEGYVPHVCVVATIVAQTPAPKEPTPPPVVVTPESNNGDH